ncbi:threonine--tRNA ligase [bacterium]|nr:threonine--tRNA ligase [bacterium]
MVKVTLADGQQRIFDQPLTAAALAQQISMRLAKEAVAVKINGVSRDLSTLIDTDCAVEIILPDSLEGVDVLRHSAAHLMAQAVQEIFPGTQVTIGPVIEHGFYYDFDVSQPFNEEDLPLIEKKMHEIAARNLTVSRRELTRLEAISLFKSMGEYYKVEIIESISGDEILSCYQQGDFIDLCRGPHVPNTSFIKHFKLMKVAGAYWRGDHHNKMLQRIYGVCFAKKSDLEQHLFQIEEALKRDHRVWGKRLELFHMQEEAPGMVFWHEQGWTLFRLIENIMRQAIAEDYLEIKTPQIVDRNLWELSGHWEMYRQNMFQTEVENRQYAIKPMNCPCHVQVFNQKLHSYRDLPLRLAEFGSCHRYEPSGALHGIMRVRNFVQDDAHIFCTEDQILEEVVRFNRLLRHVYKTFGFETILIKLSTRPEKRVGSDDLWDKAERSLADALEHEGLIYEIQPGEGAFYGPKIEFQLQDCLGRKWQCGTVQLDFSLPRRLGATYIDSDGQRQHPVMIHRAVLGSLERFIAILIEHHAGALPLNLSPTQFVVLPISEKHRDHATLLLKKLQENHFRSKIDLRNEKIGYKIREYVLKKIPYLIIIGDQEVSTNTLSLRNRAGEQIQGLSWDSFIEHINNSVGTQKESQD